MVENSGMLPMLEIAKKQITDKYGHHDFISIYEHWLEKWRMREFSLLELGIGGYEYPDKGGGSLRLFQEYFPNALIAGVDVHDKSKVADDRIRVYQGSQTDEEFLIRITQSLDTLKVVIDDASHVQSLTIASFNILFPRLKKGGIYFIEDVHTSYWCLHGYEGSNDITNLENGTVMSHFKKLADVLNIKHLSPIPEWIEPWHRDIHSIHFYTEMIVIQKK